MARARIVHRPIVCALLLLAAWSAQLAAQPRSYRIDPVHSRIVFLIDHAGFSRAIGTFSGLTGRIEFDARDWAKSSVEAIIPIASLDLGDADWNARMLARRYFHLDRYAQARFVSTAVEPLEDDRMRVVGQLELRGVTREIAFIARLNADRANPMTFKRTLGASAELVLDRADFGLGAYPNLIGQEAVVLIELEAIRQPRSSDSTQDPRSEPPSDRDVVSDSDREPQR